MVWICLSFSVNHSYFFYCLKGQPQDAVGPIMSMYGEQIVQRSLQASLFDLPSFLYPDIADLWWSVAQRDQEVSPIKLQSQWILDSSLFWAAPLNLGSRII